MKKTSDKPTGEARHWSLYHDSESAVIAKNHGIMNSRTQAYVSGLYSNLYQYKIDELDFYADRAIDFGTALGVETYAITACNAVKQKGTIPDYEDFVGTIASMLGR